MPGVPFAAGPIAYRPNKSTSPPHPSTPRAAPGPQQPSRRCPPAPPPPTRLPPTLTSRRADICPKASVDNSVADAACLRPITSTASILDNAAFSTALLSAIPSLLPRRGALVHQHYRDIAADRVPVDQGTGRATMPRHWTNREHLYMKAPVAVGTGPVADERRPREWLSLSASSPVALSIPICRVTHSSTTPGHGRLNARQPLVKSNQPA
ncbi:hypothetical protein F5144DRAFT_631889 [Chaetomium tenue]|uniref:Uncharacterized protein n=1 Tax=Chaetomium tenue TaxID=1854479 RepID=A0ACB7P8B0_9PEZI|nr:hypothetical protein F5144DRAFT_631889 [Chaetomium globosum]